MKAKLVATALGLVAITGLGTAFILRGGHLGTPRAYVTLPAGTLGQVRLDARISSESSRVGDAVHGTLAAPLSLNDTLVLGEGTRVVGEVTSASPTGRGKHKASLGLRFNRLELADGQNLDVTARPFFLEAGGETTRDVAMIGGGTVLGGVVGAVAGNTVAGGLVGAAVGTGVALHARGDAVVLGAGTTLRLSLQQPVRVEVHKPADPRT